MSVLDHLQDYRVVKVALPLEGGKQAHLDGVAKLTSSPQFEITFLPDQLEKLSLDKKTTCRVMLDVAGEHKSITARIVDQPIAERVLLEQVESFVHKQKREYFRVDASLSVSYWLIDAEHPVASPVVSAVNISGGGIRLPVTQKLPVGARVGFEIIIDEPAAVIEGVGEVVAYYANGDGPSAAFKFIGLEEEDQDAIVSFCLAEQRKQLRLKIKVIDSSS
ncbi:MAG: PilZ domain-containing protein [Desulfuromonadales bacterium]|nr:PilZ domain-containing protein [Desulfuromonadales bacterium]